MLLLALFGVLGLSIVSAGIHGVMDYVVSQSTQEAYRGRRAIVVCGALHMDITIPKSLEALVRRKVDAGHYSTEDEVVADALRLMQAGDDVAEIKRARLKDAIERGYEDAAAGKVIRLENNDEIDALFADL